MKGEKQSVAILLCTYNGAGYLADQLASIVLPEDVRGHIYVSDDGSTDETIPILRAYSEANGSLPLSIREGPQEGHCANFLSLLCAPDVQGDYFAFCDQDDVWDRDKMPRALTALRAIEAGGPALYGTRTRSQTPSSGKGGLSPLFKRPPGFSNALLQNIAGGNTMVMNACARELLKEAGEVDVVMHDWWSYLLVSGAGGVVIYDPEPSLTYRQHEGNLVGDNLGLSSRGMRYWKALKGTNREWNARNLSALLGVKELLASDCKDTLEQFEHLRNGNFWQRFSALRRGGFYAQARGANLGLLLATLLKKI